MNRKKDTVMKRSCAILLIVALLVTMLPLASTDSSVYAASVGTFNYGRTIKDAKGRAYNWKKSMMAPAYWWDAEGRRIADKAATYESSTAGLERYTIRTGGKTVTGYCVAHGIRVDTSTRLKSVDDLSKWTHTAAYPYSSRQGIKYTLVYGYQDGRHISDLADDGFSKSSYWHKTADSYTADDWYIATQVLVWEYQQLIRTDSIKGGHGRQHNGLVGADHYFDIIKGRAAQDIYNYMISRIKKHAAIASFAKGNKADADNSKGWLMKKDPATGYYTCTLKDGNQINVNIKAAGTSAKNWEVKKGGNAYTFIYKGKNLLEDGITFKFSKQIPLLENSSSGDMLIWSWSSSGSLRQAVATGMPKDPVSMYIKFRSGGDDEIPKEGEPEPDYWPTFEFPVHKDDKNPGWDGDACTPMGDATLNSTFVLYRNGEEVDRVTLDEYGSTEVLTDQPWTSSDDLTKISSGSFVHTELDADGNSTTHCTVAPTHLEWSNTEKVEYEIVEIPAHARFTEGESGTGSGSRKYEASFYAVTDDSRTCVTQEPAWSDIKYAVNYKTTEGTNGGDETARGTGGSLDDQLSMNEETFINDNWRGKLLIKKQKEAEDVFNEEGSSGSLNLSTKSHWKMYLNSGGYEGHPYLRFVEDGHTEDGAKKYRAVRDTTGEDNAVTDMAVSDTGSLFITDIPYGSYTVEEVKADDESFVLESFQVNIDQDAKQYTRSITNKKKENVIKVVKTDAETGKQVNMKGTKFYIRYMGNQLLEDPAKSENYGRLLPNASDINSTSKDYTFTCNSYGEIVLPYDLEFGTYRLEEFLLPDGYFVGIYGGDGKGHDADYGESGEYGKDDDGRADADMSWDTVKDDDPSNDLVAVYDKDGNKVKYKAGDVFNFYTFKVEKQDGHMDGEEYTKYYKAVAMKNNPVKGKMEIEKEGEVLAGFEKSEKDGFTVWTPKYVWGKLKDAAFGIYAAIDEWLRDGNDGSRIFDGESGKEIKIPTDKSTHSGVNGEGRIFEEGTFDHESGAKLYYRLGREASVDNRYTRIYTTPEQKPTTYRASIERTEAGLKYRYDIEADMTYSAGGLNYTDVRITKVTSVLAGYAVDIPTTEATSVVGDTTYSPAINVGDADGNVFDINKQVYIYEADGTKVYDTDGSLIADLADIGAKRYTVKDYQFYKLTEADMAAEERIIEQGVDLDDDGKYDKEGEKEPVKETKTAFEWEHDVSLENPSAGGKAVARNGDESYKVLTENYGWAACDGSGTPEAQFAVPEGWMLIPYIPDIEVDEGEVTVKNAHYAVICRMAEDGAMSYQVLLADGTWQDCDARGNFKKMVVEEYRGSYTQQAGNENGFTLELDGITISSQALKGDTAKTVIDSPYDVAPVIETGIGYTHETDGNTATFTATEPSAPLYFMSEEGIKTEMYYFGNSTRTLLTIPMKAAEGNYEKVIPSIKFTRTGEVVDWFSKLSPDTPVYSRECAYGNTVKAVRHEGGKDSDVYYTVEIVSDQTTSEGDGPFEITYPDGYTAKVYKDKSAAGNDVGVLVMDGVYKTSTAALGDLVEIITTDENGKATSSELPLGKYIIRELSAPNGYVADNEKSYEAELKYKDQFTPLVWESLTSTNKYVEVELDFTKVFETGYQSGTYSKDDGAVFGIYNAASISYDKTALPADTLIDTIKVQPDGKTVTSTKIPEGVYYLKELTTKNTHILNDIPFYFVAGDGVKSVPLEISKDEDGKDADGTTLMAVMDGYGVAAITVETLNRYPAARMKVDGKQYVLDTDAESEDGRVTVKTHKDMAKTKITVRSGETVDVELANGKTLRFAVDGNTYTYAYDGQQGTYIPTVACTGYYADFTAEEKQADANNPAVKTIVFADADNSSAVTAQTVYTPVMVENPDNKDEQIQKTDNHGNKVFDYHVDVKLTAGTLVSAILGKTEVNPEELADGRIAVNKETTLKLTAETGAAYLIKVDKDGNVRMSLFHVRDGAMAEQTPTVTVNGVPATEGLNIYRSITTARQDSSAKRLQIKINTADNINAGEIKNDAKEITPPPPPGPSPSPSAPYIKTMAADSETKDHIANADSKVTIADAVAYRNLTPGKEYVLKGVLMDKDTGKALLANGREVTAEKTFTPQVADGKVSMEFTFDGSLLSGKTVVVYETLYQDGKEVATHKDMTDEKQTVHFPQIGTNATDSETNDHVSRADKRVTIIDEVKYHNLIAGKEYKVSGVLMDKADGKKLLVDGKPVTSERIFKPDRPNGTVTLSFAFDGSKLAGTAVVVYESLELASNGKVVASHRDISDEKQTIHFPKLRTTASHTATGLIKDKVEYWQLKKGEEYTLIAVLMDKAAKKPVYCNGEKVTTTRQFEASANHGKVTVPLYFRQADLYGKEVVVFEYLYRNGKLIGSHEDWNDKAQTVKFSKQGRPDTPAEPGREDIPQTGDTSKLMLYIFLALAGISIILGIRRRKK